MTHSTQKHDTSSPKTRHIKPTQKRDTLRS